MPYNNGKSQSRPQLNWIPTGRRDPGNLNIEYAIVSEICDLMILFSWDSDYVWWRYSVPKLTSFVEIIHLQSHRHENPPEPSFLLPHVERLWCSTYALPRLSLGRWGIRSLVLKFAWRWNSIMTGTLVSPESVHFGDHGIDMSLIENWKEARRSDETSRCPHACVGPGGPWSGAEIFLRSRIGGASQISIGQGCWTPIGTFLGREEDGRVFIGFV